ncbi:MAG: RNA recognition motif domain-containing protein [Oligoflexales bacterium]
MSNKVFVGGLSWNTKEDALDVLFSEIGQVSSVKIITDRETGRSRGFGFIEFSDSQHAHDAVDRLDGTELDGRNLKVSMAQERAPRAGGDRNRSFNNRASGGGGGNRGNRW